ncbi:HNH endonuclease signature motif containing protein, partial [Microbacterium sp.]|uniref:HNH endonuclease signature motif containing protein n=1 Tax=Microbacterium sp. TaxID=51671 RepID=UPI0039E5AD3A
MIRPPADAPQEVLDEVAAVIAAVDAAASGWVLECPPETFRRKVKRLVDSAAGNIASRRHARAMADRNVRVSPAGDGMSWLTALIPTVEAEKIMGRLTATAKHVQKGERGGRTRDQVRADLLCAWLTGKGTATAVKTKIFVTIPVQLLAGTGTGTGTTVPGSAPGTAPMPVPVEQACIVGGDTIDPVTAAQLFLDTTAFHRVITDPVKGITLDMDRRTYRPTRAQRDWLILTHGTCTRDGCHRLAADADIDHDRPWANGGTTNTTNLRPLCPRDHTHRHRTRT